MMHAETALEYAEKFTALAIENNLIIKQQTNEETAKEIALFFNFLRNNLDDEIYKV